MGLAPKMWGIVMNYLSTSTEKPFKTRQYLPSSVQIALSFCIVFSAASAFGGEGKSKIRAELSLEGVRHVQVSITREVVGLYRQDKFAITLPGHGKSYIVT